MSCADLVTQYAAALPAARSCDVNASGQCQQLASESLSPCFLGCKMRVNDASALNAIELTWEQAGCDALVGIACPLIACIQPTAGLCVAADGGGASCVTAVTVATPVN